MSSGNVNFLASQGATSLRRLTIVSKTMNINRLILVMIPSIHKLKHTKMLGLFKKKSEKDKLYDKYEKLMAQSHALSKTNRIESDKKFAEAEGLMKEIDALEK